MPSTRRDVPAAACAWSRADQSKAARDARQHAATRRLVVIHTEPNGVRMRKRKFLVEFSVVGAQFAAVVRSYADLLPEQAVFLMYQRSHTLVSMTDSFAATTRHCDDDGLLHLLLVKENAFGARPPASRAR